MAPWTQRFNSTEIRRLVIHVNEGLLVGAGVIEGLSLAEFSERTTLIAGTATLFAGALAAASVSYSSMRAEREALESFLAEEARLRELSPKEELDELAMIYEQKGLTVHLSREVAEHLPAGEALKEHAVEELGFSPDYLDPNPLLAAWLVAISYALGALVPILAVVVTPEGWTPFILVVAVLGGIASTSMIAARSSGLKPWRAVRRGLIFGSLALLISALVGLVGA